LRWICPLPLARSVTRTSVPRRRRSASSMRRTSGACPIPFLRRGRRTGARPPRTRSSTSRTESPRSTASLASAVATRVSSRASSARVPDGKPAFVQQGEHGSRELEQAEGVGDRGAVAPHRVCDVLLRQTEFRDEALVAARFIHGREVVTLQILDQRERQEGAVVDVALHGGDPFPTERLTGPQPPLAGDQLEAAVAPGNGAHHDGLQQPGLTNGGLELLERRRVDVAARLIRVGADVGDRQLDETPFALRFLARGPQQGFEAPAETTATCDGFRHAGTSGSGFAAGGAGGGEFAALCSTRRISSCATAR